MTDNMIRGVNSKGADLKGELLYTKEGGPYREIAFPFFVEMNAEKNLIKRAWAVGPNGREAIVNGSYLNLFETTNREGGKEYVWDRREATYKEIMSHAKEILVSRIDAMGLDKLIREIKQDPVKRADFYKSFDYALEEKPMSPYWGVKTDNSGDNLTGPISFFTCDYSITMDKASGKIARIEGRTSKGEVIVINNRDLGNEDAIEYGEGLLKDRLSFLGSISRF